MRGEGYAFATSVDMPYKSMGIAGQVFTMCTCHVEDGLDVGWSLQGTACKTQQHEDTSLNMRLLY